MAKIMRAVEGDGLWLPERLRPRPPGASILGMSPRGIGRRQCCCGSEPPAPGICGDCDPNPQNMGVDLGTFSLSNGSCTTCSEVASGSPYALPGRDPASFPGNNLGMICLWYTESQDFCQAPRCDSTGGPLRNDWNLWVGLFDSTSVSERFWFCRVEISRAFSFGIQPSQVWQWRSATWDPRENDDCWQLEDEQGDITLGSHIHEDLCAPDFSLYCVEGTIPATIKIRPADA